MTQPHDEASAGLDHQPSDVPGSEERPAGIDAGEAEPVDHAERDSEALRIIGGFVALLAITVLLGSFWEEPGKGMVVNIIAGLTLLVVGLGGYFWGRSLRKPRHNGAESQ